MTEQDPFIIVGASLAGAKAAEALREEGYEGPILLIGDEEDRPYERPALSKEYLQGKAERDSFDVHTADWYDEHDVQLRLSTSVTAIDPASHQVTLGDGTQLRYAKLLLATGSRVRPLTVPGADLEGVHYLRTVADSDGIRAAFAKASRVVVIGAGWIGLETAAAARAADVEVTVLENAELPLLRVLGAEVAQSFADLHTEHGVDLRLGVSVKALTGDNGRVTGVELEDGTRLEADAVIVGVGIVPNSDLAEAAGLEVDNGVRVNASLQSSDADIYAAGDVANAHHPFLQRQLRVEHWANATYQPAVAAKSMLGTAGEYDALPYFFSDQYDLGMEYTGYAEPAECDEIVIRGSLKGREYIAFWLIGGKVQAGMNVNVWDVTEDIEALIRSGKQVDTAQLANTDTPLGSLVQN